MAGGLLLGRLIPDLNDTLERIKVDTVSLPIAIGLLAMMYPVLAKVRYTHLGDELADRRTLVLSLVLNWVVGPLLMFTLAWVFLADLPELRTGLIIVGLARCIAMVLIWNDLACGSRELAAVLVAVNSLFQIVMYSVLGWFYLTVLPDWLGLDTADLDVSMWEIAKSVLIFLGIPLAGRVPHPHHRRGPQGHRLVREHLPPPHRPDRPLRAAVHDRRALRPPGRADHQQPARRRPRRRPPARLLRPHVGRLVRVGYRLGFPYDRNASVAFTAAGNNFELAIAVAIAVFGVTSGQALAGTIGPLIEVPALVALVYVSLWAKRRFYPTDTDEVV